MFSMGGRGWVGRWAKNRIIIDGHLLKLVKLGHLYYPDLLSGKVTHLEHCWGGSDDSTLAQNVIEVFNWIQNSHWRKVSIYSLANCNA